MYCTLVLHSHMSTPLGDSKQLVQNVIQVRYLYNNNKCKKISIQTTKHIWST